MIGYEQNGHLYRLLDISSNSVFVGTHVIFDETATGPPSSLLFMENINNTNNIYNYTDAIVLTEAKMGSVGITNDDNIVVQIGSADMVADGFTKALGWNKFDDFVTRLWFLSLDSGGVRQ
jgi:hypothetical protein